MRTLSRITAFFLILLSTQGALAQLREESRLIIPLQFLRDGLSRQEMHLKGKVKRLIVYDSAWRWDVLPMPKALATRADSFKYFFHDRTGHGERDSIVYEFDRRGKVIHQIRAFGHYDYTYDAKGRLATVEAIDTNGTLLRREKRAYERNEGELATIEMYTPDSLSAMNQFLYRLRYPRVMDEWTKPMSYEVELGKDTIPGDLHSRYILTNGYVYAVFLIDVRKRFRELAIYNTKDSASNMLEFLAFDTNGYANHAELNNMQRYTEKTFHYNMAGGMDSVFEESNDFVRSQRRSGKNTIVFTYRYDKRGNWIKRILAKQSDREMKTPDVLDEKKDLIERRIDYW